MGIVDKAAALENFKTRTSELKNDFKRMTTSNIELTNEEGDQ